jgi:hypothetical protein
MSDENAIYAVKPEYVRVLRRSYLVCTDPQQYAMETMRAIAQAANECGLEGKQLTGIAFDNASSQGPDPDIILEIRKREPPPAELKEALAHDAAMKAAHPLIVLGRP